MLNEKGGRG